MQNADCALVYKKFRTCKPLFFLGLRKLSENISTRHLTVLTTGAIFTIVKGVC